MKSFSQLKNDFSDIETFYLDFDDGERSIPRRSKSEPEIKGIAGQADCLVMFDISST